MGQRPSAGFTLIELMVVITIIAVMAGMIVVASGGLGGSGKELRQEAERLRAVLTLAIEESILRQQDVGVEFTERGYRFMRFERVAGETVPDPMSGQAKPAPPRWKLIEDDDTFRVHEVPESIRMQIAVEAEEIGIQARDDEQRSRLTTDDRLMPQVFLLSSGEVTPFQIEMYPVGGGAPLIVEGDMLGNVRVVDETLE